MLDTISKQSAEKFSVPIDFADRLPTSATIASGTAAVLKLSDGTDTSASMLTPSATLTISGSEAAATIQAGSSGQEYSVSYTVTLSTGAVLKETFRLKVKDEI